MKFNINFVTFFVALKLNKKCYLALLVIMKLIYKFDKV